jgi:D-tyrosyl-tRNA(Tyr) deacylase
MRAVVQRVHGARVEVSGAVVGAIQQGLVCFLGVGKGDGEQDGAYLVSKVCGLRVFEDEQGKMSRSLGDVGGGLLVISQFTLYGDLRRGRRPSFESAMPPAEAERLYEQFVLLARERAPNVATGRFRSRMRVVIDNDGPVTLVVDSK